MTSTRVIRPSSFKVDTTYKRNTRPVSMPTPAKLRLDTGVFQDIGAKLIRPRSRKALSWTARSKGLKTSAGLQAQLLKEEGLKIQIGDKTLKQLLQVEVADTRKQEYIKNDGSIGVRVVPVLDAQGNPVMVKKNLSIPGSAEYVRKSLAGKLNDIQAVMDDRAISSEQKQDTSILLLTGIMAGTDITADMLREINAVTNRIGTINMINEIPADKLLHQRFVDSQFIVANRAFIKALSFLQAAKLGYLPANPVMVGEDLTIAGAQSIDIFDNLRTMGSPEDLLYDVKTNTFINKDNMEGYLAAQEDVPAQVIPPALISAEAKIQEPVIAPAEIPALAPIPEEKEFKEFKEGPVEIIENLNKGRFVSQAFLDANREFMKIYAGTQAEFLGYAVGAEVKIANVRDKRITGASGRIFDDYKRRFNTPMVFDMVLNTFVSKSDISEYEKWVGKDRMEFDPKGLLTRNMLEDLTTAQLINVDFLNFNVASQTKQLEMVQRVADAPPPRLPSIIPMASPAPPLAPIVPQIPAQIQIPPPQPQMQQPLPQPQMQQLPILQTPPALRGPGVAAPIGVPPAFVPNVHTLQMSEEEEKAFENLGTRGFKFDTGILIRPNQSNVLTQALTNIISEGPERATSSQSLNTRLGGPGFDLTTITPDEAALIERMLFLRYITVSTSAVQPAPIVKAVSTDLALIDKGVNALGIIKLKQMGVLPSTIIGLSWTAGQAVSKTLDGDTPEDIEAQALSDELKINPTLIGDDSDALAAFNQIFTIGREQGGRGKKNMYTMDLQPFYHAKTRMGKVLTNGYGYIRPKTSLAREIYSFG